MNDHEAKIQRLEELLASTNSQCVHFLAEKEKYKDRLTVAVQALESIQRECQELLGASPSYIANAIKMAKAD